MKKQEDNIRLVVGLLILVTGTYLGLTLHLDNLFQKIVISLLLSLGYTLLIRTLLNSYLQFSKFGLNAKGVSAVFLVLIYTFYNLITLRNGN